MSDRRSGGNTGPSRLRSRQRRKVRQVLQDLYGDRCYYCTRTFKPSGPRQRTLDHLYPLSRGGTHELCNLVLSCSKCNNSKGDMTWWEYRQTETYSNRRATAKRERPSRLKIEILTSLKVAA